MRRVALDSHGLKRYLVVDLQVSEIEDVVRVFRVTVSIEVNLEAEE